MAISFNTGTTAHAETASSVNVTIPAGVLAGDVMVMMVEVFTETGTQPTISITGNTWTLPTPNTGTNPEVATAGSSIWSYGFLYVRTATAGDIGASITISESGSAAATTWFAVALAAYTGANGSSPVDVLFGANTQAVFSGTAPSGATVLANDWPIYADGGALNAGPLTGPGTSRENVVSSALVCAAIDDGNGSVAAGTTIGGGTWSGTGSSANWFSMFTLGLAAAVPPVVAAAPGALSADDERKLWWKMRLIGL